MSGSTVSKLNQKVYKHIEKWRSQPITGHYAYVYLDGIWLKRSWGGEVKNMAVLIAIGVNNDGYREILGVAEGMREDEASWLSFLTWLKERGLSEPRLCTSDKCLGLVHALAQVYPHARWQRCLVHFYRNVLRHVSKKHMHTVTRALKALYAQDTAEEARKKAATVVKQLRDLKLTKAAECLSEGISETLTYFHFPNEHWRKIRSNNVIERLNKEIRRRTRVVGAFPDGQSALMLVSARLRYVANKTYHTKRYMDMSHFMKEDPEPLAA